MGERIVGSVPAHLMARFLPEQAQLLLQISNLIKVIFINLRDIKGNWTIDPTPKTFRLIQEILIRWIKRTITLTNNSKLQ